MATVAEPETDLLIPPCPVRRFSVAEYHLMIEAGVFADDYRFELLEGWIISKSMTRLPPHDVAIDLLQEWLSRNVPPGWRVRIQSAITLGDSEPEPDLAVVRGVARDYLARHPGPGDLALVVEVSDSSLREDQGLKARVYARAGLPTYWIVNVAEGRVEVHTDPTGPGRSPSYRSIEVVGPDGAIPLVIDGREVARVAAREVLP